MSDRKHQREIPIVLGGHERFMRPTFQAIMRIESLMGQDIVPIFERFNSTRFGARLLAVVIAEGLRGAGDQNATVERVGDWLMETGLTNTDIIRAVAQFFELALTGSLEADDDTKKNGNGAT